MNAAMTQGERGYSRSAEATAYEGQARKRIVTAYGFWIFLLSDMVMFSCFFAAFAVL
jgi:cytochrome o ubiquinol oxidase subunit III